MKNPSAKSYLQFSRTQRIGLLMLFALIVIFQVVYFFVDFNRINPPEPEKKTAWLSLKVPVDSIGLTSKKKAHKSYPFNPNFITDFKGYMLGMSVAEIDRLLAFRKTNRYVNSAEEFQAVTQVSDSLLHVMQPYFKFPDWVKNRQHYKNNYKERIQEITVPIDINLATKEDLKKVYGIGDGLSERILKEKEKLGGFVSMEQLGDVWGLSPEVISSLNKGFKIGKLPDIVKINVNSASVKELSQFPYFRYQLAKSIVTYRSMNGGIRGIEDLVKISTFPVDKVNIIALYLEF